MAPPPSNMWWEHVQGQQAGRRLRRMRGGLGIWSTVGEMGNNKWWVTFQRIEHLSQLAPPSSFLLRGLYPLLLLCTPSPEPLNVYAHYLLTHNIIYLWMTHKRSLGPLHYLASCDSAQLSALQADDLNCAD